MTTPAAPPPKPAAWHRAGRRTPDVYVRWHSDGTRALVKGPAAEAVLLHVNADSRWSSSGLGYVVEPGVVDDLVAAADALRLLIVGWQRPAAVPDGG